MLAVDDLVGRQIRLRDWRADDVDLYHHWMQPGHRWQELDGPYYPTVSGDEIDSLAQRLRQSVAAGDWPRPRRRLVIARLHDSGMVGLVSRYWQSRETNWLSLGIVIYDPVHWGRGMGTEALGLWCDYLWQGLPELVRLDLRTWSGNQGMMQLAEKLGFQLEARFRQARIVRGAYYDGLGYGVLRSEWAARYPRGFAATLAT